MSTNYSEQIFQSIDTIISQRLNEVSFDKTEICEIISQDKNDKRKYLVSNGSLKYEAYSDDENRSYLNNQKVYVRITNGDYSLRKIITGSYTTDEIPKNLYTNPFNHLVVSSKYNWITETNKLSAIAYKDKITDQAIYLSNDLTFYYSGLGQFNYIGLEFSATTGFGGTTGEFQIIIDLLDNNGVSLLTGEQLGLLTLSSKQLYGNPYYLNSNLKFQHLFNFPVGNFSDLTKVKKIKITLFTKGDFNYEGRLSPITINDLTMYFGFDSSENEMSENKVALVLDNTRSLEYTTANDKKQMSIDWRDLNSGAIYNETPNMQYPEAGKYNIYWLQYSESIGYAKKLEANGGIDIAESGTYWKTVKRTDAAVANAYTYTLSPSADWKKEQIKVIIKKVGTNDYVESNGLTFTNTKFRAETGTNQGSKDTLRLTLSEGDDGIYNSYGIDNKLLYSYNLEHSLTVDYIDNTVWNKDLQKVIWKIPKNATMIKQPDGWSAQGNFYVLEVKHNTSNTDGKTIKFKLSDQFSYNKTNNTIYCEIIRYKDKNSGIKTDEYQGSITLQFGLQGTNGTGWSFNIISNQRALTNKGAGQNKMTLTATFEDSEGNPIADSNWVNKVKWSWYQTQYGTSEAQKRYSMSTTTGKTTDITRNDYIDCYAIIQAKLEDWQDKNGNKIDLVAYMPIAAGDPSYYLTGASRVVYNNAGTSPSYDEAPYVLYASNHTAVNAIDYTYSIISPETNKNKCFTINTTEGNLKPLSLLPTQVPKMALQVYDNKNKWASYIQPILVLKNGYQSKLLNEWNGTLTIDNTNNSIFSALMGAGVKNNDNTFTGVLLGAVGTEISSAKTGIYGMQSGQLRYKLDENGNFYVGTGSDNRIDFSGTTDKTLTIEAKKFTLKINNSAGANQLYLGSTANTNSAWLQFKDKVYFYSDGTATIGGWNIGTRSLSYNAEELYFGTGNNAVITGKFKEGDEDTTKYSVALKLGNNFGVQKNGTLYAKGVNINGNITAKTLKLDKGIQIGEDNLVLTNTKAAINTNRVNIAANKTTIDSHTTTINSHTTTLNSHTTQINSNTTTINSHTTTINSHTTLINGKVSFSDLSTSGKTTINGGNITTGKIDAKYIDVTNLTVKNANIESLSFGKVTGSSSNAISASNLSITGGSINMYPNPGYLVFGTSVSSHPYVSALNVGHGSGGVVICNGGSRSNVGEQIGYIDAGSGQYLRILTAEGRGMNITGRANMAIEVSEKSSYESKGYLRIATNPYHNSGDGSMGSNPGSIYIYSHAHITLHAGHKNNEGHVYVGHGAGGNSRIATDSSGPSSLNLKTNLQKFDDKTYNEALQLLSELQLYNYTYKYNNLHPKKEQFGFIIDELLENELANKFFYFRDEVAGITQSNNIDYAALDEGNPYNEPIIYFKRYDEETLIKYLLVCNKALLQQIEELKKEIKEIKQNEI